jgi:predicted ATPase/DNA-binding SARP family transcriptional activator
MTSAIPLDLTDFVGRDAEIEELAELLRTGRLLTLTGAGGSGKTRLAFELLRSGRLDLETPVAMVELATLADAALLTRRIAESFGIQEEVGPQPAELVELLRNRSCLLVLDNCEHIVDEVAAVVDALLRSCLGITVLATSREALGVKGERAWAVPALSLPSIDAPPDVIARAESVRLFVDRARDVSADFDVTADNASAIAEVCRRLDGMPLAIELAAARARVLTPDQIRDRLDDAFRLLTRGGRTAVPRHRTLRAAIDWSHELLPDRARILLRRLGVFRGGFTLEAVESVGADQELPEVDVLDVIEQLVDRSLVTVSEAAGEARYVLLETVRQYAVLRLTEASDETATRARHALFYLELARAEEPNLTTAARRESVERLSHDLENIRAALTWSLDNDPTTHIRLVAALWWFWYSTRHWSEARTHIDTALTLPEASTDGADRARLLFAAGALAALQTRCDDAVPVLFEAERLAREIGDDRLLAYTDNYIALATIQTGDLSGRPHAERAQSWFRRNDDLYGLRQNLLMLATAFQVEGHFDEAEACNTEAIAVARRFGMDRELAVALQNTAASHITNDRMESAEAMVRESLDALCRDPAWLFIARSADLYAEILGRTDKPRAARILGASSAIRDAIHARPFKVDRDRLDRLVPELQATMGTAGFDAAWNAGRCLTVDELLAELIGTPVTPTSTGILHTAPPPAVQPEPVGPASAFAAGPAAQPADIEIHALGPLHVRVRGVAVPDESWPYGKPRELLLYLALYPNGRSRDQITRDLWPASTPRQSKNSFHVTLHHLRKVLGESAWIITQTERYRIDPTLRVTLDADAFEAAARAALRDRSSRDPDRLRPILALHRGELFEDQPAAAWQEEHRDRIRRLHVDIELLLANTLDQAGQHADAADIYHSITLREELNEEAHRGLMMSWARNGSRARAVRHYERVVEILRDAIDAEPEPETTELWERLRAAAVVD